MYTEQIEAGQDYDVLKKCVSISILDFKLFAEEEFYSCFHLREDSRSTLYTDKLEFHVIELPKFPEELKEDSSDILLWAKFINSERKEDFEMIAEKNQYIESAYRRLQNISQDKQMQLEYEAREKAVRDHNQMIKEARAAGEKAGRETTLKGTIEICRDLGLSIDETIIKLGSKFSITEEEAKTKVNQYWNA